MTFALADHEIRSLYDGAKDKKAEVPILAQLCAVPLPDMAAKLREMGYDLPEIKVKRPSADHRPKKADVSFVPPVFAWCFRRKSEIMADWAKVAALEAQKGGDGA